MSKKLILVMALSLVLVSGGLSSALADCGCNPCGWHLNWNPCNWHLTTCGWHCPSCFNYCNSCSKDLDRPNPDNPPAFNNNNLDRGQY